METFLNNFIQLNSPVNTIENNNSNMEQTAISKTDSYKNEIHKKKSYPYLKDKNSSKKNFNRSKSMDFDLTVLNKSFENLLAEYIPVTAILINAPKNYDLNKIYKKINQKIDGRTFLRLKYDKKEGILFIKFRNKYYYNYYFSYLNRKAMFEGLPFVEFFQVEDNLNLWNLNPKFEEEKIFILSDESKKQDYDFYKNYIYKEFKKLPIYK